jgi:hypothetical protein
MNPSGGGGSNKPLPVGTEGHSGPGRPYQLWTVPSSRRATGR